MYKQSAVPTEDQQALLVEAGEGPIESSEAEAVGTSGLAIPVADLDGNQQESSHIKVNS